MTAAEGLSSQLDFLAGGGELGGLMRAHDWSGTPLGPPEGWPQSLRSAVSIMLNSRYPIALYWGEALALLYNDAWSPIPGGKHPWALGRPGHEVWPEIWDAIGPLYSRVLSTGEGVWQEDELLPMRRHGYVEECYFNFTFSPVRGEGGRIDGIFNAVVETTDRVLSERRLRTLGRMGARQDPDLSAEGACQWAARLLAENKTDAPFALVYVRDGDEARLAAAEGLEGGSAAAPIALSLMDAQVGIWPLGEADRSGLTTVTPISWEVSPSGAVWPEPVVEACVTPISAPGEPRPTAFLVVGINPRRALDAGYRSFMEAAAGHIGNAIATARAYAEERRRAEALAEIDRAKTAFFSNVSHEFRTPLTLMLGPLEDALAEADGLPPQQRERLEVAHRNSLRLLRLVNSLLDFSRIEAGRVEATFRPTDLAGLTADLVSSFRAATDRAGLQLLVNTPLLDEPVYVDREMWEKVVLNLVSNAFKFTHVGVIEVELRETGGRAKLAVRDTGTGVPASELPRLFDRFHRVEGAHGRSFEGSGIGLALVQELVKLHGGEISVESEVGRGSTFTVSLPLGCQHLPPERVEAAPGDSLTPARTQAFVGEAMRWLPGSEAGSIIEVGAVPDVLLADRATVETRSTGRVVLADDNADLRTYIARLLSEGGYQVEAAVDGEAALEAVRALRPDLLVTDVMMPRLDGFGLLRAMRGDPSLRDLPVLMLSARSGEEAKVEGLDSGADDYLTKPFSARELLARVSANIAMARLRREAAEAIRETEARATRVLAGMSEGYVLLDRDFRVLEINDAGLRLDGRPRDAIVGRTHWEAWPGSEGGEPGSLYKRVMADGLGGTIEIRQAWPDGRENWYAIDAHPVPDGVAIFYRDVTERRRADVFRNAQNTVLEAAVQDAPVEETLEAIVRAVERASSSGMLGSILLVTEDGKHLRRGAAPSLPDAYNAAISGIAIGPHVGSCGAAAHSKAPVQVADIATDPLWVDFRDLALAHGLRACWSTPILSGRGEVLGTFAMYYPEPREPAAADLELVGLIAGTASLVIERKNAEAGLHRAKEDLERRVSVALAEKSLLADIVEGTDAFVQVVDPGHRWLAINKAAADEFEYIYGVRPKVGDCMLDLLADRPDHQEAVRTIWGRALGGEEFTEVAEFGDPGRARRFYEMKYNVLRDAGGRPAGAYQFVYDVTPRIEEQRRLAEAEEALRQSQKMEAMGQLTGGVAHDFNNLLTPIIGSLDMLVRRGVGSERERRLIDGALQSADRAKTLVQRLLAFARRQPLQPSAVDVWALVQGMTGLIGSTLGPTIDVQVTLADRLPPANADPNQLEMALLNLAVNARDAMPDGGVLKIEAKRESVRSTHRTKLGTGHYVLLCVSDTGVGMDEATLARAVEPFFSTKGIGKGTGLGLSSVHGLAAQLGGALMIDSRPGQGTTIELWLPVSTTPLDTEETIAEQPVARPNRGKALLVDDEELVRMSTADMLMDLGFEVTEAGSAEDALRLVDERGRPDLLVTDHLMPGMSGVDLARTLRAKTPNLPVLIVSGYAEAEGIAPDLARLTKPFRNAELAERIASLEL